MWEGWGSKFDWLRHITVHKVKRILEQCTVSAIYSVIILLLAFYYSTEEIWIDPGAINDVSGSSLSKFTGSTEKL